MKDQNRKFFLRNLQDLHLNGFANKFRSVIYLHFFQHVDTVGLYRSGANTQFVRNLLGAMALCHQFEHFLFARSQFRNQGLLRPCDRFSQYIGNNRTKIFSTFENGYNGFFQVKSFNKE